MKRKKQQDKPKKRPVDRPVERQMPDPIPDPGDADMHQAQGLPANLERLGFKETMEDER